MTFVFSLTQMLALLSVYVMLSILLSILVCAAVTCYVLVSVQVSAPYFLAGSQLELYTCLFRQMTRLLCVWYADVRRGIYIVNTRSLIIDNLYDTTSLEPLTPNHMLTLKSKKRVGLPILLLSKRRCIVETYKHLQLVTLYFKHINITVLQNILHVHTHIDRRA